MWTLEKLRGEAVFGEWSGVVDAQRPANGVGEVSHCDVKLSAHRFLQVSAADWEHTDEETPLECYSRGADFIATYEQTEARQVRPQVYWSLEKSDGDVVAIEVVVSAQTSLLDTNPRLAVKSEFAFNDDFAASLFCGKIIDCDSGDELRAPHANSFYLWRFAEGDASYAQMAMPSDYEGSSRTVHDHGECWEHRLGCDFLEKGVIRRARVLGLFLPQENDIETASATFDLWRKTPPPLTT